MDEPSAFLLEQLPLVERIITSICRRKGVDADEMDDFAAEVKLHLVDNDYAVVRAFQGRSSFATYMAAVVTRQLLDYRNHQWGKWHASADAERLGTVAIDVERALYRDRISIEEAWAALAQKYSELTRAQLDKLVAGIPRRMKRRIVDLDEANSMADDRRAVDSESLDTARRISSVVRAYIVILPEDERLILKLRFHSEMTVAEIARSLGVDQSSLYRRFYKHFQRLRLKLERAGVSAEDVAVLIGKDTVFLDFQLKNQGARPSEQEESAVADTQEELP